MTDFNQLDLDLSPNASDISKQSLVISRARSSSEIHADFANVAPRFLERPTSSSHLDLAAEFIFARPTKVQTNLAYPSKSKQLVLPKLRDGQDEDDGDITTALPQVEQPHQKLPEVNAMVTMDETSPETVPIPEVQNPTEVQQDDARETPEENPFQFDVRPIKSNMVTNSKSDTEKVSSDKKKTASDGEMDPDVTQKTIVAAQEESPAPPQTRRWSMQALHTVAGNSRVTKNTAPRSQRAKGREELSSDDILDLYIQNVKRDKVEATETLHLMEKKVEQLVRVNCDYQAKLEEAEQEIEFQGRELDKCKEASLNFKDGLSKVKSKMNSLVRGHIELRSSAKDMKKAQNSLSIEGNNIRKYIVDWHATVSATEKKLAADVIPSIKVIALLDNRLTCMEEQNSRQLSKLTQEQQRSRQLEAFIQSEVRVLGQKQPLMPKDLEKIMVKLGIMENLISDISKEKSPSSPTPDVNINVPGVEKCLEILQSMSTKDKDLQSNIMRINPSLQDIEKKISETMESQGQQAREITEAYQKLKHDMQNQTSIIKDSIDASVSSLENAADMEKRIVRYEEASKHKDETMTEVKRAREFAEQQAQLPKESIVKLSQQIDDMQKSLDLQNDKCQVYRQKIQEDDRRMQNLRSQVEEERQKNIQLNEQIKKYAHTIEQNDASLETLNGELKSTATKLHDVQHQALEGQEKLRETSDQLAEQINSIHALRQELDEEKMTTALAQDELKKLQNINDENNTLQSQILEKAASIEALENQLDELRNKSEVEQEAIHSLQQAIRDGEAIKVNFDAILEEKLKDDEKILSLEQTAQKYQALKIKYDTLETVEAEARATQNECRQLKETIKGKDAELTQLQQQLEDVKAANSTIESQTQPLASRPLSKSKSDATNQEDFTESLQAVFDHLIDLTRFQDDDFDSEASQLKPLPDVHEDQPRRKANREFATVQSKFRDQLRSQFPPSQSVSVISESQPQLPTTDVGHSPSRLGNRSSPLSSPPSSSANLFDNIEGPFEDASIRPKDQPPSSKPFPWIQSNVSTQSDEMLLDADSQRQHHANRSAIESSNTIGPSPRRLRSGSKYEPDESQRIGHSQNIKSSVPQSPAISKEKHRPNSAAKRQASSDDFHSSPVNTATKRMRRDHSAAEVKPSKRPDSINGSQSQSTSRQPMMRMSLPTGSKGSGLRINDSAGQPLTYSKKNKQSKSSLYDSRFKR